MAVAAWARGYNDSALDRTPLLWVGHYGEYGFLGAIWDSNPNDQMSAYYMASPFAFSDEVCDTFIFQARQRKIQATRLSRSDTRSIRITGWKIRYTVNDNGRVGHAQILDLYNDLNSWVDRLCRHLGQARLERTDFYTFDDALDAAIQGSGR